MLSAVYATPIPSVCLSVRLSHACFVSKWLNISSKFLSRSDRTIILVFRHQGRCINLRASPPTGAPNIQGGSDFRPICSYISETVIDRGIVAMEDEYKVVLCSIE